MHIFERFGELLGGRVDELDEEVALLEEEEGLDGAQPL